LIAIAMLLVRTVVPTALVNNDIPARWYSPILFNTYRHGLISQLSKMPGLHLVFVRYSSDHVPNVEWVYNGADIDGSKIVWARDMGTEQNLELVHYYNDRKVWVVEPDKVPPSLSPYNSDQPLLSNLGPMISPSSEAR